MFANPTQTHSILEQPANNVFIAIILGTAPIVNQNCSTIASLNTFIPLAVEVYNYLQCYIFSYIVFYLLFIFFSTYNT